VGWEGKGSGWLFVYISWGWERVLDGKGRICSVLGVFEGRC